MTATASPDICIAPRSHADKRKSIIDAAAGVFCREGFAGANIDLVAMEAGVSRQTVYNHHRDKEQLFQAVVREVTERINAEVFDTLATFPDRPVDLKVELTGFGQRMARNCLCSRDGRFLRKLMQSEGERYPTLFSDWWRDGPAKTNAALGARFARLALSGHLDIDDPDVAASQFMALVHSGIQMKSMTGQNVSDEDLSAASATAVDMFLRAYGRHPAAMAISA